MYVRFNERGVMYRQVATYDRLEFAKAEVIMCENDDKHRMELYRDCKGWDFKQKQFATPKIRKPREPKEPVEKVAYDWEV